MNHEKSNDYATLFKALSTVRLEGMLPVLLKELRHRDSNHMKGDAITTSRTLRSLRASGQLPHKPQV